MTVWFFFFIAGGTSEEIHARFAERIAGQLWKKKSWRNFWESALKGFRGMLIEESIEKLMSEILEFFLAINVKLIKLNKCNNCGELLKQIRGRFYETWQKF